MAKRLINSQSGFSMIEVMIALVIFGIYSVVIIYSQVNNQEVSQRMSLDLRLHTLAQMKMNEVLISTKEFTNATENSPETGSFEIDGLEHYKFKVEYKRNEFPDFSALMGQTEEEAQNVDPNAGIKKIIFEKLKKNIEEMVWQVKVTVTNTEDEGFYELNSWVNKANAKIDTNFSF